MIKEETARAQPALAGEHVRVEAARDQDRLLSYGPFDFTYTANGELETKRNRNTGEEWIFAYDALGNLLSVGLPNGDLVEYLVDGLGRRVGKKKNGVLQKQWIYRDALKPAAELDGSGMLVSEFVYAAKSNVPDYVRRGGATYRVISDQLGSPRYVVNVANAGDVPFTASYTSFGEMTGTGLDWMPFGFAGGAYDEDSGLVRFGVRDYDPHTGRWTTHDPVLFGGGQGNLYVYVADDPINRLDPTGLLAGVPDWLEALDNSGALQAAGDFSAGISAALTFGLSNKIIDAAGLGGYRDECSGSYSAGQFAGLALGLAAGATGAGKAAFNIQKALNPNALTTVARWGRPGLEAGDWVMQGGSNWANYLGSGKWQVGLGNEFASFASGEEFEVARSALEWPGGIVGDIKGLLGQRMFMP